MSQGFKDAIEAAVWVQFASSALSSTLERVPVPLSVLEPPAPAEVTEWVPRYCANYADAMLEEYRKRAG